MIDNKKDTAHRHPIRVVSKRTGLKPDRIRAWERRYQVVTPARSGTGRRLYSDEDIERLIVLRRLINSGWRIGDIAHRNLSQLRKLERRELEAQIDRSNDRETDTRDSASLNYRNRALDAIRNLDKHTLNKTMKEAMLVLSPIDFRDRVLVPLLTDIGTLWRSGGIRVVHEHLASAIIRTFIETLRHPVLGEPRPSIIIATPAGQLHEFGALMAGAAVDNIGWKTEYFGPNLPAEEIAAGVAALDVKVVAVSAIFNSGNTDLFDELRNIRQLVASDVTLIVGGAAAADIRSRLGEIGWVYLSGFGDLQEYLEMLHTEPVNND